MQITSIMLSDQAHGVLGQTSQAEKAELEAIDMNGTGTTADHRISILAFVAKTYPFLIYIARRSLGWRAFRLRAP